MAVKLNSFRYFKFFISFPGFEHLLSVILFFVGPLHRQGYLFVVLTLYQKQLLWISTNELVLRTLFACQNHLFLPTIFHYNYNFVIAKFFPLTREICYIGHFLREKHFFELQLLFDKRAELDMWMTKILFFGASVSTKEVKRLCFTKQIIIS